MCSTPVGAATQIREYTLCRTGVRKASGSDLNQGGTGEEVLDGVVGGPDSAYTHDGYLHPAACLVHGVDSNGEQRGAAHPARAGAEAGAARFRIE